MPRSRRVLAGLATAVLVSLVNAIAQLVVYVKVTRELLPVGWGGFVGPFVEPVRAFVISLPIVAVVLLLWNDRSGVMKSWTFWLAFFLPFSALTAVVLAVTHPLDGGGTLLTRFFGR